jgi:hypothetical protein
MQAPPAPTRTDGCEIASLPDGSTGSRQQPQRAESTVVVRVASATRRKAAVTTGDLLRSLLPTCPKAAAERAAEVSEQRRAGRDRLAALTGADVAKIDRMEPARGIEQVLELAGVDTMPGQVGPRLARRLHNRRLDRAELLAAAGRTAEDVLEVALDVALSPGIDVGAVLARSRCPRLLNRALAVRDVLTRSRADWTLAARLAATRGEPAPVGNREPQSMATELPKDCREHPAVRSLKSKLIGAAMAGDWRALLRFLGEPIARERRLGAREVSDWSGVPEQDIEAGLAAAREAAAARFDAARRATA